MINLKEAITQGKLKEFIKEREGESANRDTFNKAISLMVGKSSKAEETFSQEQDGS